MTEQEIAFEKLSRLKVGALFMDMGTGKTKVALDLICSKIHKIDYILYICPFSIKDEIESERLKWHPELTLNIVGCESIGQSDRCYLECLQAVKTHNAFIVVDESLKIKNREAKRTERIIKLGEYAEYKLILNGTPVSKNVLDLWTQMQFLSPKILCMSYNHFRNTYAEYYLHGRLKGLVKRQHNIEHLISKISPYIFDSELDIATKKQYIDIPYSMNGEELEEYELLKNNFIDRCIDRGEIDFFSLSQILQAQYCSSKDKQAKLQELIAKINDKVIVFVKYLGSIPQGSLSITGAVKERKEIIEQFRRGKNNVLYITYGCGAFGLNLQFCKHMIFADHTFDYSQRIQAEARIYRTGQTEDVCYYNLWCECGLERLIKGSIDKKHGLLDEIKKEIERVDVKKWIENL